MASVAQDSKVPHQTLSSLMLPTMVVIYKRPDVTQLRIVPEVRAVQGEEKRGQHRALGCSGAADQC